MTSLDLLIEVPYLWLNDGYGQTSPQMIKLVGEVCNEHNINWGVSRVPMVCTLSAYSEDSRYISKYFVNPNQITNVNTLLRYNYPGDRNPKCKKLITYTMFETDSVPSSWVDKLNQADLVILPSDYLVDIFQSKIDTKVGCVYLPLHDIYYSQNSDEAIIKDVPDVFTFSFVGTISSDDRKGIKELSSFFYKTFRRENAFLVIKCRGSKIKESKVLCVNGHSSPTAMATFYLSSNASVFPSRGEGVGLPQIESSLLGRPVILAKNTSPEFFSKYMPWVLLVDCEKRPALYKNKKVENPGNWSYVDMREFTLRMKDLYNLWISDKEEYLNSMILAHKNNKLREILSKENIKKQIENLILPVINS